jgi:ankyrin repeat protein
MEIQTAEPLAELLTTAIHQGDVEALKDLLQANPGAAQARIVKEGRAARTLLHIATDWPGHFPNVSLVIAFLIQAGADPNAPMQGGNAPETPLHWAASSNDVEAIDALLDGGANIESPGAIFTGGAAMSDAVIFAQWDAARRLLARGAKTTFTESAGLGLVDRLALFFNQDPEPPPAQVTAALWHACRGGHLQAAQVLIEKGADLNWIGWDNIAPLDGARQSGSEDLIAWLLSNGARSARDV